MLIISRYNEDVSWSINYPHKIIYNKGDRSTIPLELQDCVVDLPNVGREAHTILTHIITHYDTLDKVNVFSQGTYNDHLTHDTFKSLFNLNEHGISSNLTDTKCWGKHSSHYNFTISDWKGPIHCTGETYGQWYERLFLQPFPHENTLAYTGAIFSASDTVLRKFPKQFYIDLLQKSGLLDSSAPEAAHFMERTWFKMYGP